MQIVNNTNQATVFMAYTKNNQGLSTAMERLSTGLKINHPIDDPTGLALSTNMKSNIAQLTQASSSEQSALQYLNTLDAWYQNVNDTLNRMAQVAMRIDDPNLNTQDKYNLATEYNNLALQVNNVMTGSSFNNMSMYGVQGSATIMPGSAFQGPFTQMRIVVMNGAGNTIAMNVVAAGGPGADFQTIAMSFLNAGTIATAAFAGATIGMMVATYTPIIATSRATIGAYEVQINSAYQNNINTANALTAVDTNVRSANIAQEAQNMAQYQILTQSSMSMMSQANSAMMNVLTLLR
jgi:flagellin